MSRIALRLFAALAVPSIAFAPAAHAEPGPGSGETFFVDYLTRVFTPPATEEAARALLPLAQLVCEAKQRGESDAQAANLVLAGNGVETLGRATGSSVEDQQPAMEIVNASTLAYCPQYNMTISDPVAVT